jgi:hypothetical protein
VTQGKPREYVDKDTVSGVPSRRFFCGDCGSPLWSVFREDPENADVMVAILGVDAGVRKEFFWTNAFRE